MGGSNGSKEAIACNSYIRFLFPSFYNLEFLKTLQSGGNGSKEIACNAYVSFPSPSILHDLSMCDSIRDIGHMMLLLAH